MKKISTFFKKDPNDLGRVIDEINPENQWVIDGNAISTRKFDGIATSIIDGNIHKRLDVKKGKTPPQGAIPCQEADKITGHHPHWVKCDRSNPADKIFFEAFDLLAEQFKDKYQDGSFTNSDIDGTYELCGETISTERFKPKLNVEGITGHQLIKHGSETLFITNLSFEGIKAFLQDENNDIEGIVFHHKTDGRMCKIRKKDFGIERTIKNK